MAFGTILKGAQAGMDLTWVTNRIAVGGGIWHDRNMIEVVREGITHIIDMQIEFDDSRLAEPYGVKVLWNPTDDDFRPKPALLLKRGVEFALEALEEPDAKVFVHCAAGVHRAPMMALAVLRAQGWSLEDAVSTIEEKRDVVDFAEVYVRSVEEFIGCWSSAQRL
jgi:protein-tyrosine phosphatase